MRTATQGEALSAHVLVSPLGEDYCAGEEFGRIWNSLELSERFSRFLEVSGRMLLEGSGRNGFLYIGVDGILPT